MWMFANAIACGNTFILKPSEKDPSASVYLAELLQEAGLPDGVFNVVHGDKVAVDAILEHPDIAAVSFVGSTPIARYIYETGTKHGKRVQALGGAKNSMLVMPDADLERAVPAILGSAFGAAGQRCLAGSVCVVVGDRERQQEVREALVASGAELKVGDGADAGTDVCPMVSASARERVVEALERAAASGSEVPLDGRGDAGPAGTLLGPTIATVADPESELARDELFGPLLALHGLSDLDAALEFVNGSRYGNAGSIFTQSGDAVRRDRYGVEAGMLGVNVGVPAPVAWFPFSGWKDSFDGDLHANGPDAVDFYTRKKVVTTRW
jgi:malonate-semialdehyde dehydrogenase (acetylating) / methylmalonate-semialdehyde dehydrogenase